MFQLGAAMFLRVCYCLFSGLISTHSVNLHKLLAPGNPLGFFGSGCGKSVRLISPRLYQGTHWGFLVTLLISVGFPMNFSFQGRYL